MSQLKIKEAPEQADYQPRDTVTVDDHHPDSFANPLPDTNRTRAIFQDLQTEQTRPALSASTNHPVAILPTPTHPLFDKAALLQATGYNDVAGPLMAAAAQARRARVATQQAAVSDLPAPRIPTSLR